MTHDLTEPLGRLLEAASDELQAAAGGGAVCAFTKAGTSVPGIKYREGRWAALNEVSRRQRRRPDDAVAAEIQRDWSAALRRAVDQGAGPDWTAYRQGGVDALSELLGGAAPAPGP